MAGRGLMQAGICGRWLPVWLPRIPLAILTTKLVQACGRPL
jgi:hypothetical protein